LVCLHSIRGKALADVLAVDDEGEWREPYAESLVEMGHGVRTSADGKEVTRELQSKKPDVVVLDTRMPSSGLQMLWPVRRCWPDVPAVIPSACAGRRHHPDLARVDAFLERSTDPNQLAQTTEQITELRARSMREAGPLSCGRDGSGEVPPSARSPLAAAASGRAAARG
jgi:DNA-binding NtrC family response regulator